MSDDEPPIALDVQQLARELIAEDLDLDDIYEDRTDASSSLSEASHRASAMQLVQRSSDRAPDPEDEEIVLLQAAPGFGPMRPPDAATSAATLPAATYQEATTTSQPLLDGVNRRRAWTWIVLALLLGASATAIATYLAGPWPHESETP